MSLRAGKFTFAVNLFIYMLITAVTLRIIYVNLTVGPLHQSLNGNFDLKIFVTVPVLVFAVWFFWITTRAFFQRGE